MNAGAHSESADRPEVSITGIGITSALGYGAVATAEAWRRGDSAVSASEDDAVGAARIEPPHLRLDVPRQLASQTKFLSPSSAFAAHAAHEALSQAGFEPVERAGLPDHADNTGATGRRKGFWLAQIDSHDWACKDFMPGMHALADRAAADAKETNTMLARRSLPYLLLPGIKNNAFSFLATWYDLQGPNTSLAGLSGTGAQAFELAFRSVQRGQVDMALVVATGMLSNPVARLEWPRHHAAEEPPPGDGAVAFVLESSERAARRNQAPVARVRAARGGTTTAAGALPDDTHTWAQAADPAAALTDVGPVASAIEGAQRAEDARLRLGDAGPAGDLLGLALALAARPTASGNMVATALGTTGTWTQILCTGP